MKRFVAVLVLILSMSGIAGAQRGLACHPVFRGKIVPSGHMIETKVGSGSMSTYKLEYYHSVQFQADQETAAKVSGLVSADAAASESAEIDSQGGVLTYALIQLAPFKRVRRYLCYQARPLGPFWKVTIVYLEGSATIDDLRTMFDKKEEQ